MRPQKVITSEEDAMKRLVTALLIVSGSASLVSAQSLAEVAKKEKDRRKKVEAPAKNEYNETSIRRSLRTPAQSSTVSNPATTEEGSATTGTAAQPEDPAATQSYWRDRASAIDKKISDLEARLQSPEMTTDIQGGNKRAQAERDLAAARSEREALAQEARRKGVPPGWLR
jgi:hypothetical protein